MSIDIGALVNAIAERLNNRRFYSPAQVADALGIDSEGVLEFIHSGELKASNVARNLASSRPRWRISHDEFDRFVASRATKPATAKRKRNQKIKDYFSS